MIDSRETNTKVDKKKKKKKSFRCLELKDPRINIIFIIQTLKKEQKKKNAYRRSLTFT